MSSRGPKAEVVIVSKDVRSWIPSAADRRKNTARAHYHSEKPAGPDEDTDWIEQMGVMAQWAVRHWLGLPCEESDLAWVGDSNEGVDLEYRGLTFKVKSQSSRRHQQYLMLEGDAQTKKEEFLSDIGVLCTINRLKNDLGDQVNLLGWVWREEFEAKSTRMKLNRWNRAYATDYLHPMSELKTLGAPRQGALL